MRKRLRDAYEWSVETYLLFVVIGVVVGGALAPVAMETTSGPDGTVAVVQVQGSIGGDQVVRYQQAMERARNEADAVVIVANSGGGSASASEGMYLQTKRVAQEIPVVASVDAAALSGAYFTIAPADRIYVKPASLLGSIGVVATVPPEAEPNDLLATTGPEKLTGGSGRSFFYKLESIQAGFLNAVFEQRGDRIRIPRSEVARASSYTGATAVRNGLADGIGDRQRAVRKAAELAGLEQPRVVEYGPGGGERTYLLRSTYLASAAEDKRMLDPKPYFTPSTGVPTFLMVPAGAVRPGTAVVATGADLPSSGGAEAAGSTTAGSGDDAASANATGQESAAGRWAPDPLQGEVGVDA